MEKKIFVAPVFEISNFEIQDVIATSGDGYGAGEFSLR